MSKPVTIDLRRRRDLHTAEPTRKLLYLVLLLAAKDGADEVRFEPVPPGAGPELEKGCWLRYRIAGIFHELVPPAIPVSAVRRELARLAGLGPARHPLRWLLRRLARARGHSLPPLEANLRLVLGQKVLAVSAVVEPAGPADQLEMAPLVLSVHAPEGAAEAGPLLAASLEDDPD
jgi:hypothetical protein